MTKVTAAPPLEPKSREFPASSTICNARDEKRVQCGYDLRFKGWAQNPWLLEVVLVDGRGWFVPAAFSSFFAPSILS
jgi:hypothetical protein